MKGKHLNISSEKVFDIVNNLLLVLIAVIIVVPLWNIVISSFSSGKALAEGGFIFFPKEYSLENYRTV